MATATKIKLSIGKAYNVAKGFDYTGSATDVEAVKAFLGKTEGEIVIGTEVYQLADIEIDAPAQKRRVTVENDPPAQTPPGTDPNVAASLDAVAKLLTRLDKQAAGTQGAPSITVTGGQTVEQKQYERKIKDGKAVFGSVEDAELMADWFLGQHLGQHSIFNGAQQVERSRKNWADRAAKGFDALAATKDLTTKPGSGALLVSEMFSNEVIRLFDTYGVVGQYATVIDNIEGTYTDYKSDPTAMRAVYPASTPSGSATTSQEASWGTINLIPKLGIIQTRINRELLASSRLNVVDEATQDLAWVAAYEADQCAFNGAGQNTEGGIFGLVGGATVQDGYALSTMASAVNTDLAAANSAGSWSDYTLSHFHKAKSKLRAYAYQRYGGDVAIYCTQAFYDGVLVPLAIGTSRALASEVFAGGTRTFLGLPVRFVEAMNRTASTGTTTVDCWIGNLKAALRYGRGRNASGGSGFELAMSEHKDFDINAIRLRGIIRHDANFHDRGANSTSGATGSLIAMYQV